MLTLVNNHQVLSEPHRYVLHRLQYCVKLNPMGPHGYAFGKEELVRGPTSFFLYPHESLENGVQVGEATFIFIFQL